MAAVTVLMSGAPAFSQDLGLRGSEGASSGSTIEQISATPAYQPTSAGAVSENLGSGQTESSQDIFYGLENEDPFGSSWQSPGSAMFGGTPALPETAAQAAETAELRGTADDEAIAASRVERQAPVDTGFVDETGNERAVAIETRRRTYEETPYAPVGLRAGTMVLFPTLEQGLTYTTNADQSADGEPALLSESTLRLNALSDWSRHSASVNAYGTYRKSIHGDDVDDLFGGLDAALQLDLANAYTLRATVNYLVTPESATSPVLIEGTLDEPLRQTINASLGLSKTLGSLQLAGTARFERDTYGDADLSTGGTLSQEDRNSTLAAFVLRTGWQLSPALTPFVEAEIGKRFYDNEVDAAGYKRSALRSGLRAGLAVDLAEKLTGEVSAGWIAEDFSDNRLRTLSGASFDADLLWSPLRGTTVALSGNTTVEGTTTAGASGSVLYSAALSASRELRANLTGTASLGLGWRDFKDLDGRDLIWTTEASLTYWFNRYMGLVSRARYERLTSDIAFRDAETASIFLGLKFQR